MKLFSNTTLRQTVALIIALAFLPIGTVHGEVLCGIDNQLTASFPSVPEELLLSGQSDETFTAYIENPTDSLTFIQPTFVIEVLPRVADSSLEQFFQVPAYQAVATTVAAVSPQTGIEIDINVPAAKLPAGSYELILHARYGDVAPDTLPLLYPQTRIGSIPMTISDSASYAFSRTSITLTGTEMAADGTTRFGESQTVDAELSITNPFADQPLRADLKWSVYRGSVITDAALLESWSEEVRLLPNRSNSFTYQFGSSVESDDSVYTLVVSLRDQLNAQQWWYTEQILTGIFSDITVPLLSGIYFNGQDTELCYSNLNDSRFSVISDKTAVSLAVTDTKSGGTLAALAVPVTSNFFTVRVPSASELNLVSQITDTETGRVINQDTVTLGCTASTGCKRQASTMDFFPGNDESRVSQYLLLSLAGLGFGFLLLLILHRRERERLATETTQDLNN